MARYLYWVCLCYLLCLFSSCNTKSAGGEAQELPFNPHVEAFTSGKISRYTPVYLIFNQDIAQDKLKSDGLSKLVRIKPEVAGEFSFENNRTIVFKPTKAFERNTTYKLTANLSEWFDVTGKDKEFAFEFSTFPLALRANLESMDINAKNENGYDIVCTLFTPDKETPETVEPLVRYSEKADAVWQHSPDGKKHQVTLQNVQAGNDGTRTFTLSVAPNKSGVAEDKLLTVPIPDMNDFDVYDVTYVTEPERYVEVTFTKDLDSSQDMQGLAFIAGNTSETVNVEGNRLRLYPDSQRKGVMNVHLTRQIRSKNGLTLKEDVTRQIEINTSLPDVKFIGQGVVIPQSTELLVPFQAVYLRGVVVRVIKILEQNIGQFLQVNNLDGTSDLMRVGRLVARKTIFLDEDGSDLSQWNTYAVDLKKLMEPEPGAIYRVELSFNKDLSAYPCDDSVKVSREQLLAEDEIKFKEESSRFDDGGYYYYNGDFNWNDYNYSERNDPCSNSYYYNKVEGKNVLATNLGLMAMAGEDNEMTVLVHNLLSTSPENGVNVSIYNYQNQVLASGTTDGKGEVKLKIASGKPFYIIASQGYQRSYLRVDGGSALSLSSFDVSGEVVQKGIKGFIYGDRGVWRPGDTLFLSFMLNDRAKKLPANHPVVMELYNPLGQLYLRKTQTRGELGVYSFAMPTEPDAPTGAWNVNVNVGGVSFTKRLRVESIKPNRLKIDLTFAGGTNKGSMDKASMDDGAIDRASLGTGGSRTAPTVLRGEPLNGRLHVEWLQGATARNLKYDIQGTFISTPTTFKGYKDFYFDDPSKTFNSEESKLISGTTDDKGDATIQTRFEIGTTAPGMLMANFVTRAYEESGDFSIDANRMLYSPYKRYAGIKSPQQTREQLNTGSNYTYEVASTDYQGNPQANTELDVQVYKVYWYWWWSSDNSSLANYVSDSYNKPVKQLTVRTGENGRGTFQLSFSNEEWGTYFISVKDKESKHSTGVMSYFDWPYNEGRRNADGSESANMLSFKTDKDNYKPGEKLVITIPSAKGSRAVVSIENGTKVLSVTEHTCDDQQTTIKLDVTKEMQPNAYVYVTLLQPHGLTQNDLPIRMYGVVPFTVTSPESHLYPQISVPDEIKPEAKYEVVVSEKDGREMAYTLAIVDEGLLDLTRFRTPEPWKAFNAREALGVSTWDMYNYVVGAYGGRIEQLFSIGGDDALNKGPKAIVNRFKPVVQFEGPFLLRKGKQQRHIYTMPNYNGRVKVMVVAGNGEAYGHADKSVFVRKPVMLLGTLPRVIGVGEEMVVPATVFATENGVGNVDVSITCSANMEVIGAPSQQLHFTEKSDKQALFRIRVKDQPGAGRVTITASGKGDKSVYTTDIEIRSVSRPQVKVLPVTLEAGKSWKETVKLPGMAGTNSLSLEMSDVPPLNLSSRLSYLIGYPHGCVEQITSKGFPQLYVGEFAALTKQQQNTTENAVKEVIRRLRSYQTVDGAFSYWPGGTSSNGWGTVYATHFLLSAEAKGYLVPDGMKRNVLNNLRRVARDWKPVSSYYSRSEEMTQAYRLYVLALGQVPEVGAMNRLKENKSLAPMSRWLLASAYALVGRTDVAKGLIEKTTEVKTDYSDYDLTFGSDLRDQSIRLMTLTLLGDGKEAAILTRDISKVLSSDDWLSTQSTAFALVSLSEYMTKYKVSGTMEFTYAYGSTASQVSTTKNIWTEVLLDKAGISASLELKNTGKSTLFARVITEGIPAQGKEEAYANGLSMAVSYTDPNGRAVDITKLPQGTNFVAVVTVKNPSARGYNNLVLTEIFPAGWEILNTRFLNEGAADSKTAGINYQDIRDDKVYSYIDQLPSGRQVTVKVNLCAVYPGRFYLPPVYCEAMYDNLIRANTEGKEVVVE
ncbi:alpha-2-macroglobulin family protein [Parabacteroides timonensis]|uniref:alpha-2-macroglobulin family protein n=1 Tax=Parabacteroides timonensis TaxID=1871013 RepID=UPI000B205BAA|nr:MG2 domain-containing protein [Parabacteroides timonensis]